MKQYILGYYAANNTQLGVISKESNRKILDALRDAFPSGLNARGIEERTSLPIKTVYACLKELNRELFIDELGKQRKIRGRPLLRETQNNGNSTGERHSSQYVIEDRSRTYDMQNQDNYVMAPGNVDYPSEFVDAWHTIVTKEEENELCTILSQFLERSLTRVSNYTASDEIRKWAPERFSSSLSNERNSKLCCTQCGINHEARDFMRAMMLHLVDHVERHDKFIEFMKSNDLVDLDSYQTMVANIEKFHTRELVISQGNNGNGNNRMISLNEVCTHFTNITNENTSARTSGCEECEMEGIKWVGLRLCLTCGHIGCCDSSKGMHATKHFVSTTHPVIVTFPDKKWKWCYVDKIYG
jgi:Zn-finger in ubiquitin-hydrolases and other protein